MTRPLVGSLVGFVAGFVAACFSDPAPADPVEDCKVCAADRCTTYYDACIADPDCSDCFDRPKSLECLANTLFHAAASCSCEECADKCTYMCPGGQGACDSCSNTACGMQGGACLADIDCAPCLDDPFLEGCATNPLYAPTAMCSCENCGQECIWTCPMAGNTCAACIGMQCSTEIGSCRSDEACNECFENPAREGCDANETYAALTDCLCPASACADVCDVLFCTPP